MYSLVCEKMDIEKSGVIGLLLLLGLTLISWTGKCYEDLKRIW